MKKLVSLVLAIALCAVCTGCTKQDSVKISRGTVDAAEVNARRLAELALQYRASAVILAHNHPGGIALPSREDIQATENIVRALGLVHVLLRDHIILTETEYFSMREENRLPFYDLATGEMLRPY